MSGILMFVKQSAWFSTSVDQSHIDNWESHGGKRAESSKAMFIFSEDADAEDTKSLYMSAGYIEEHVAIFHPDFIEESIKAGGPQHVAVGKFMLPASGLHKVISGRVKFKWEAKRHCGLRQSLQLQSDPKIFRNTYGSTAKKHMGSNTESLKQDTEVMDIEKVPHVMCQIQDFVLGEDGCDVMCIGH